MRLVGDNSVMTWTHVLEDFAGVLSDRLRFVVQLLLRVVYYVQKDVQKNHQSV